LFTGFHRIQSLPDTYRTETGSGRSGQKTQVSPFVYALVTSRLASYYEIKYQLSAMEVLDLVEVLILKSNQNKEILDGLDS